MDKAKKYASQCYILNISRHDMRENEILVLNFNFQEEVKALEKTKASLAQELVNLSNRLEELEDDSKELEKVKASYEVRFFQ